MVRVSGEVVEGASHLGGGGNQESRQESRSKLRLYEKATIWGMTAWIFVGFDTLLSSGKRFYFLHRGKPESKPVFFFSKTHGWHFGIEIRWCPNTWNLAITDYDEHIASNVKTNQVEVRDIVFLSVKGANLKNKPAVWGKCLPIFRQPFSLPPPCQFLPWTFRLMCLPSAHLTAVKLPFSISSEKSEFLAIFHLRRN